MSATAGSQLPVLFSAVQLSGNPAGVANYLANFNRTGMKDLGTSLGFGEGGMKELLRRNQQLHVTNRAAKLRAAAASLARFTILRRVIVCGRRKWRWR